MDASSRVGISNELKLTNEMQQTKLRIYLTLCLLLGLRLQTFVRGQETTTERSTVLPDNVESDPFDEIVEELLTTTALPETTVHSDDGETLCDCQRDCLGESIQGLCEQLDSNAINSDTVGQNDPEIVTETIIASEEVTINLEGDNNDEVIKTDSPNMNDEETTPVPSTTMKADETTLSPINCTAVGQFPHPNNCQLYFNCTQTAETDNLQGTEVSCPEGLAFNTDFSRCMRDLSPCSIEHGGFECSQAGSFPDPKNDTSVYYRCVPHLDGKIDAFHKYIVKCGTGQIYMAQIGKCFVDINAIGSYPIFGFNPLEPSDEQIIKLELKQWKALEKTKLKEEKMKQKYEKKLQKELAKQQAKEAKEKAKAEEKQKKKEQDLSLDNDGQ